MPDFDSLQAGVRSEDHCWGSGIPHPLIVKDSRESHTFFFVLFFLIVGLAARFNNCIHF